MSVFKRRYKTKKGKEKAIQNYYVDFRDHDGIVRRVAAFSDKSASKELERNLNRLVSLRMSGMGPDAELSRFLEACPVEIRERLASWNVIQPERAAAGKKLSIHIEDWRTALTAKRNSKEYVTETVAKINRLSDACGWMTLSDVSATGFDNWRMEAKGAGLSSETANMYLTALRNFCNWLIREKRMSENPVSHLEKWNTGADRRFERRDYSGDELSRLLAATEAGAKHHGMTGQARALLYRTAFSTGLRWGELRSLTRASFDFEAKTVTIQGKSAKNKKTKTLPLLPDVADDLKDFLRLHLPAARAFTGMWQGKGADMLREDMKTAGIEPVDEFGNKGDFHAFRHTFGSMLAKAGVPLVMAQKLMRHSTPALTANIYTHLRIEDEAKELAKLPAITAATRSQDAEAKTGTDDAPAETDQKIVVSSIGSNRTDNKDKITTYSDDEKDGFVGIQCGMRNKETSVPQGVTEVNSDGGATGF